MRTLAVVLLVIVIIAVLAFLVWSEWKAQNLEESNRDAFHEGIKAGLSPYARFECPYPIGSDDAKAWEAGTLKGLSSRYSVTDINKF